MRKILNLIAIAALAVVGAQADINLTLDNPNQSGSAGQTLTFFGTVTNTDTNLNDPSIFLNGDNLNFPLGGVNDNFFAPYFPISLAPNTSSGDIDLFDITLPNPATLGTFGGTYELLGGADGGNFSAQDNLAQVNFSATVTPEPAYNALLAAGVILIAWLGYRQRRTQAAQGPIASHSKIGKARQKQKLLSDL